jgi:uncharacterized protein
MSKKPVRFPVVWFLALTFTWSWTDWFSLAIAGARVNVGPSPSHFPGLFGPMIAAFLVTLLIKGEGGVAHLIGAMFRIRAPWCMYVAALSPLAFGAIALVAIAATGGAMPVWSDFGRMGGAPTMSPITMFFALIVLNGFAEEVGWRGFLLPRLQLKYSPLMAALVVAVPWSLWHVPMFFVLESYRDMSIVLFPGFFIGLLCGSVVLTWIYNRSGGSILLPAVYHAGLNLMSATVATHGAGFAAVVTTLVIVNGVALIALEIRATRNGGNGPLSRKVAAKPVSPSAFLDREGQASGRLHASSRQ